MTDFQVKFSKCLDLFADAKDKTGSKLSMIAFAADASGERANHLFLGEDRYADLRSVSKVITALVLGNLIYTKTKLLNDVISLESRVEPLLRKYLDELARSQWSRVRIVDLLNNTIGHEQGFLFRKDLGDLPESDYLAYIFRAPVLHKPGTHFSYSNVGPFLFSVIVQDWLGKSLHEIAQERILAPMEIDGEWRNFGEYTAGCTGLSIKNHDLLKIACLLRDGGTYNGQRLVETSWIEEMCKPRTLTPLMFDPARVFPKYAYGIGLWVCENGNYYCDGTNGQYLIVLPRDRLTLSTTGEQPDMKPITKCMVPFVPL
jgi:CubicO group peptidase (beta-lactamase class C family)